MLDSLKVLIQLLLHPFIFIPLCIYIVFKYFEIKHYKESSYYKDTKVSYLRLRYDAGRYGEYLIYKYLKEYESNGIKFLFNIYVPKSNDETSEIDVLMITHKGIFVFESKNYSGWIFGSDTQKHWYQTLPKGRGRSHKEKFYNPILQNNTHIKYLKSLIGNDIPIYSVITFSERCTLKKLEVDTSKVCVIKRNQVRGLVKSISDNKELVLTDNQIENLYQKLYPYTQVDESVKAKHIDDIKNRPLVCPICGSNLILRTAKNGNNIGKKFYGCSNYPRCKYIRNIDDK